MTNPVAAPCIVALLLTGLALVPTALVADPPPSLTDSADALHTQLAAHIAEPRFAAPSGE